MPNHRPSRLSALLACITLLIVAPHALLAEEDAADLIVTTSHGPLQGTQSDVSPGVSVFRGVPFAAPPIGDLRWQQPQPLQAWDEPRDAVEFGPRCVQPEVEQGFYAMEPQPTAEDCLYLNVWTTSLAEDAKLPVMVWIHGGAFLMGSGSETIYHGDRLAQDEVVVVTVNYRLGLLGFFAHPALSAEAANGVSGNQALYDQIAALQWVQDNIAAFGGDPENVTIFGESAGSMSVCYLVATPLAEGLFQKAIGQSGGCFAKHPTFTESSPEFQLIPTPPVGDNSGYGVSSVIVKALGIESNDASAIEQMRAMSTDTIFEKLAENGFVAPWRAIYVDGQMFPTQMRTLMSDGRANQVHTLVGSTRDEGVMLWPQVPEDSVEDWKANLNANSPAFGSQLIDVYASDAEQSTKTATQEIMSDLFFGGEMRKWAELVTGQDRNAFVYVFNHAPPIENFGRTLGAFHGGEIQYVFQSHDGENAEDGLPLLWDASDRSVANTMRAYWVNFAKSGDPNGEGLPTWPKYDPASRNTLAIEEETHVVADFRKAKFDVIEQIMRQGFTETGTVADSP